MYIEESFTALLQNTYALELLNPLAPDMDKPSQHQVGDTFCFFHAGTLTWMLDEQTPTSVPIHLAHTGPFALLLNAQNGDILSDFMIPFDIYMIVDCKFAFFIRTGEHIFLLRFHHQHTFDQWRALLPHDQLQAATLLFHQWKKEGAAHVSH